MSAHEIPSLDEISRTLTAQGDRRSARVAYLLLSAISGFVELGAIAFAARGGYELRGILVLGLAYQAGSLITAVADLTRGQYQTLLLMSAASGGLSWLFPRLAPLALLLLSVGLQGMREGFAADSGVSTFGKRLSRIIGFASIAGFGRLSFIAVPLAVGLISSAARLHKIEGAGDHRNLRGSKLGVAGLLMVLHQMHYFCYSYFVLVILISVDHMKPGVAGIGFALGWISYSTAPLLLRKFKVVPTIVIGHLCVAGCLVVMAVSIHNVTAFLVGWFATGFGGGTVFAIRKLNAIWPNDRSENIDLWEQFGHILGVVLALIVTVWHQDTKEFFYIAGSLAMLVGIGTAVGAGLQRHSPYSSRI